MRVWLLHPAEPVPLDGPVRLFRYGVISQQLARQGHEAVQWASTFNHFTKTHRPAEQLSVEVAPGYQLELLPGRAYRQHVSLARLASQRDVARAFRKRAPELPLPDVIVVSLPTLELAEAAIEYGQQQGVPVLVDIRDLWPDFFLHPVPKLLRPLVRPLLSGFERQAQRICAKATALLAVSEEYLNWGLAKAGRTRQQADRVVHHGYTCPELTPQQVTACREKFDRYGLNDQHRLRCCYFGTLGRSAGIDHLADAARATYEAGREDIQFVLCGGGPRAAELQHKTRGLPNVEHLGWVDSIEIAWIMSRSHVGLAAYEADVLQSLPNKPIEYLAGGLPVANTLPGELAMLLREYDCGPTFLPQEGDRLASWLVELQANRDRRMQLARNAHKLYAREFDADRVYSELIQYLTAIVSESPARVHAA